MRTLALAVLVVLSGCVEGSIFGSHSYASRNRELRWSKEGGAQATFLQDRYQCLKESQREQSRHYANRYAAAGKRTTVTDPDMFVACMSARGYTLDENGPFAPPEAY